MFEFGHKCTKLKQGTSINFAEHVKGVIFWQSFR